MRSYVPQWAATVWNRIVCAFVGPSALHLFEVLNDWRVERVAIAPRIDGPLRAMLEHRGVIPQDLTDLIQGL